MVFTKGIIDCYINSEEIGSLLNKKSPNTAKSIKVPLDELSNGDNYFTLNRNRKESLYKSFHEVIFVDKIYYIREDVDQYVIYREDTEMKPYKLAIIWRSDDSLVEVVDKAPDVLKKFFKLVLIDSINDNCFLKKIIKQWKFKFLIKYNKRLLINKSIEFYAFFKDSNVRDTSLENISNFKVDIQNKDIVEKDKIISLVLLVLCNFVVFRAIPDAAVTTVVTSLASLVIYIVTSYFTSKRNQVLVNILSLTFNPYTSEEVSEMYDEDGEFDNLLEIDLNESEEERNDE